MSFFKCLSVGIELALVAFPGLGVLIGLTKVVKLVFDLVVEPTKELITELVTPNSLLLVAAVTFCMALLILKRLRLEMRGEAPLRDPTPPATKRNDHERVAAAPPRATVPTSGGRPVHRQPRWQPGIRQPTTPDEQQNPLQPNHHSANRPAVPTRNAPRPTIQPPPAQALRVTPGTAVPFATRMAGRAGLTIVAPEPHNTYVTMF